MSVCAWASVSSYLVWSSWRYDNTAATCCTERTWRFLLLSPPEAAADQNPSRKDISPAVILKVETSNSLVYLKRPAQWLYLKWFVPHAPLSLCAYLITRKTDKFQQLERSCRQHGDHLRGHFEVIAVATITIRLKGNNMICKKANERPTETKRNRRCRSANITLTSHSFGTS